MARSPLRAAPGGPGAPRFRRSVVRDLQNRLRFALVGLGLLVGLHVAAMMGLEGLGFEDSLWLTFTTITTTGYGDLSAKTPLGRAATIVLIYLSGIFLVTQAAGAFFELRTLRRDRMRRGEWRWDVRDHVVFVNAPEEEPGDYLRRLLDQLRRSHAGWEGVHAVVVTEAFPDGLPPGLEDDPLFHQVRGRFDDPAALEAAGADRARVVVVLAEREGDRLSDSRAFDVIHRLRESGCGARVVAECVDDRNRERFARAGAGAVVRPLRGYPEMIVRAIVAPGAERVMEGMFSSEGEECLRFDVTCEGLAWSRVVRAVLDADHGTALGYEDAEGRVVTNPSPRAVPAPRALFVLVGETQRPTAALVQAALDAVRARAGRAS